MTPTPNPDRLTVTRPEGFVVFLVGARINRWWMVPVVWAIAMASNRIMRELQRDPERGLLGFESFSGRTTLTVQYWRSEEDLLAYANDRKGAHVPAWARWARDWVMSGAVGIWHETYVVEPGTYECIYQHMPPFGLGKIGPLVPAEGSLRTAAGRLAARTAPARAA